MNKNDTIYLSIIVIISLIITIIISINFNNIPLIFNIWLYDNNFWAGFLLNLHNSIIDIILFWFLLSFISKLNYKKNEFNYCINKLRLNSNIKNNDSTNYNNIELLDRLNLIKSTKNLNLTQLDLRKIKLNWYNLENTKFNDSLIDWLYSQKTIFKSSNFRSVKFNWTKIYDSIFINSKLNKIITSNSVFNWCNFSNSIIINAKLEYSSFKNCNFKWSDFKNVSYLDSDFSNANFIDCKNIDINNLFKAKSIYKAKFDKKIVDEISKKKWIEYIIANKINKEKIQPNSYNL